MNGDLIFITPNLSFGKLKRKEVSKEEAYRIQVYDWLLKPVDIMHADQNRNANGMAALGILLMFFEPHGQYILGIDSNNKSKKCFKVGFERFVKSLDDRTKGDIPNSDSVYKWARCGLFHSTKLNTNLLVDTVNVGSGIFTKLNNPNAFVCNPWRLSAALKIYLDQYILEISNEDDPKLVENFNKTFKRLVGDAMEHFCN